MVSGLSPSRYTPFAAGSEFIRSPESLLTEYLLKKGGIFFRGFYPWDFFWSALLFLVRKICRFLTRRGSGFNQTTFPDEAKGRPVRAQGEIIVKFKGSLDGDGLVIDPDRPLPGEVFYPILILAEENLDMVIQYRRMFKFEITLRIFSDGDGELFE